MVGRIPFMLEGIESVLDHMFSPTFEYFGDMGPLGPNFLIGSKQLDVLLNGPI